MELDEANKDGTVLGRLEKEDVITNSKKNM